MVLMPLVCCCLCSAGMKQGEDPLKTLPGPAGGPQTVWQAGSNQTVAMGMWANHGGMRVPLPRP